MRNSASLSPSISLRQLAIAIFVLTALSLGACQRIKRPFAGENKAAADAPKYTATVNLNGVPQGN